MPTNIRLTSVIALSLITIFTACKKDSTQQNQEPTPELTTHTEDQNRVSTEMDAVNIDLNYALENNSSFSGRLQGDSICSAVVTFDTIASPRKITITYNGADCGGLHTRTGSVIISMASGVHWRDSGATISVAYQNFKVVRVSDKKSITINGTHTLKNTYGGLLRDLLIGRPNITHDLNSDNMSITFDDGTQRNWKVARRRVYSIANGGTIAVSGTHTEGSESNVAEWGTDRFGHAFTTSITQPLVVTGNCQFRLISGQITHNRMGATASVTFGLDKNGNAISCPAGNYYYKLTWAGPSGATLIYIAPY